MTADIARDAALARLQARVAELERRRRPRRLPLALAALLVALIPLATMAATPFTDLTGGPHDGNIAAIYNAGITTGCEPGVAYCPTGLVTREEMASFLARAAGLGGNPPVANAATAVNATNAQNATTAQSAATAQSASNAAALNGFAANGIVRTKAGTGPTGTIALEFALQPVATVALSLPGPGFVVVTSSVTVTSGSQGVQFNQVGVGLVDRTGNTQSPPQYAQIGTAAGSAKQATLAPTWVFHADSGGERVFELVAGRNPFTTGTAGASYGMITATYVAFGPGGAQAAATDDPSLPLGPWDYPAQP